MPITLPKHRTEDADELYEGFAAYLEERGIEPYPHQDEAIIELLSGNNVVLATPTGSGKSLVATAGMYAALAGDRVSFYTAPIKALVNEKFFELCQVFGPDNVGMLTGDASVNADAPIIACTAEILANIALREGDRADVGMVVMDEFHYYGDPERGWAWQVPLLELPQAQFLLMSATLGDVTRISEDLSRRNGRETSLVTATERPVPLSFEWSMTPLAEKLEELVTTKQAPVYVVHQTQAAAAEHAASLRATSLLSKDEKEQVAERLAGFRFAAGFGRTLGALLRKGIGVHHAGMLPRYRRLVEQLAQQGLLKVICGTDTLGIGINVPIRTVLFTALTKFDGSRHRVLKAREFHQIAGRAGRAGYDTSGYVVVQAPEHVIENHRAAEKIRAKHGDDPKRMRSMKKKQPPEGFVVWTEQTFDKLVNAQPEQLVPRMKVDNAMILNVVARHGDPVRSMSRLMRENHESLPQRAKLARRAIRLGRSLLDSGVLVRRDEPDAEGRTLELTVELPEDFALNQPLAHFALAALELLDPDGEDSAAYALDVVSVIEAILDSPHVVLRQQQWMARGEAVAEMKADGMEYEERMEALEDVSWPQPLAELLEPAYEAYREQHPWLPADALEPKSIVRAMWEGGMSFTDFVGRMQLSRSEGVVLRYLTDAYRTLQHTVPESFHNEELDTLVDWLGETIRQTDSSLLDEWEALMDPDGVKKAMEAHDGPPPPARPLTANDKAFRAMLRRAMWRRVELAAKDDVKALYAAELASVELVSSARGEDGDSLGQALVPLEVLVDEQDLDDALGAYWDEHDEILLDADARGPRMLTIETSTDSERLGGDRAKGRVWAVRQTIADPEEHHDWVMEALVDLDASDAVGEPVVLLEAFRRL